MQPDGTNLADWLQNLAALTGQAAARYLDEGGMDITAICQARNTHVRITFAFYHALGGVLLVDHT